MLLAAITAAAIGLSPIKEASADELKLEADAKCVAAYLLLSKQSPATPSQAGAPLQEADFLRVGFLRLYLRRLTSLGPNAVAVQKKAEAVVASGALGDPATLKDTAQQCYAAEQKPPLK